MQHVGVGFKVSIDRQVADVLTNVSVRRNKPLTSLSGRVTAFASFMHEEVALRVKLQPDAINFDAESTASMGR